MYELAVDTSATFHSTNNEFVLGFRNEKAKEGFQIEFISDRGEVIKTFEGITAKLEVPSGITYLRAKVSYTKKKRCVL